MMQQESPKGQAIVTAALLVIGDEILSGRTKDKNIGYTAEYLTNIGVDLREVRVVSDIEDEIVAAINTLRAKYDYLFTTGGIGPTHDDITADCVAKAFAVALPYHPEAVDILKKRFNGADLNEARMRMTRIPEGGTLVYNKVSGAPGFRIGNVFVMAGIPVVMQAMLDEIAPMLNTGKKMLSESVRADAREGDIGGPLGEVAKAYPDVTIGSYPFIDDKGPNTSIVIRAREEERLGAAVAAVREMLTAVHTGLR